jgi:hypothetical protein
MATFTVYTDVPDVLTNAALSVETASLIGGNATLTSACAAGATSLSVGSGQAFATSGTFTAWILDGPNSESIAGCTYSGSSITVPSPGTTYAHAEGVSVSSAGTQGALASFIRDASAAVETYCRQGPDGGNRSLWQQSWTETISGPYSSRAVIDRDGGISLKPYHFPVTAVSSLTVQYGAQSPVTIDRTYLVLPDAAQIVTVPAAQIIGAIIPGSVGWYGSYLPRNVSFWATLTYTGGPVAGTTLDSVPSDIRRATLYLVLDRLSLRINPTGAANLRRGDMSLEARLRGDTSGKSILRIDAEEMLYPYRRK